MRLDIGKFLLKDCLQCEFRETLPLKNNKIDTLSIHGLGDGFWGGGGGWYSGFQVTGPKALQLKENVGFSMPYKAQHLLLLFVGRGNLAKAVLN